MERNKIYVPLEIREKEFYTVYFNLYNLKQKQTRQLTKKEIEFLTFVCYRDKSLEISKNRHQNGLTERKELADDFGLPIKSMYGLLSKLEKKGALKVDEDEFLRLAPAVEGVRDYIKQQLEQNEVFEFDYCFLFKVNGRNNNNQGSGRIDAEEVQTERKEKSYVFGVE